MSNHQTGHILKHTDILYLPLASFTWVIVTCLDKMESYLINQQNFPQKCFRKRFLGSSFCKLPLKVLWKWHMWVWHTQYVLLSQFFHHFCTFCWGPVKAVAGIGSSFTIRIQESHYVWQDAHTMGEKTEPRQAEERAAAICHLRWRLVEWWVGPPKQFKLHCPLL